LVRNLGNSNGPKVPTVAQRQPEHKEKGGRSSKRSQPPEVLLASGGTIGAPEFAQQCRFQARRRLAPAANFRQLGQQKLQPLNLREKRGTAVARLCVGQRTLALFRAGSTGPVEIMNKFLECCAIHRNCLVL
jgi:hypothetical protein